MNKTSVSTKHVFIWNKYGFNKINIEDVVLLKASRSYCEIHLLDSVMEVCDPLRKVMMYINNNDFIRISRSYVVNLRYVNKLVGNTIIMYDDTQISIGKEYREELFANLLLIGSKSQKYQQNRSLGE